MIIDMDYCHRIVLFCVLVVAFGCQSKTTLSGVIDYVGSAEIFLSKPPLHYKYSDKLRYHIETDNEGSFSLRVPVDSTQLAYLKIDDQAYPLLLRPGNALNLQINRADFPVAVQVEGYQKPWDIIYADYWKQDRALLERIEPQQSTFKEGDSTNVIPLFKKRYQLAEHYFRGTPFEDLYFQAVGEYLVKRLEEITYQRSRSGINPEKKRQQILQQARELNFFSFKSLHAQRAGIRDFTNAYANTFGVADSLEKELGQPLMAYDVKRLGYQTLDSARTSVLKHINERRAKAYANMHLIAERIGEMSLDIAEPSYRQFLSEYSDFPRYTSFLKSFYTEIERVSPGQPAIPFSLPNSDGEMVQLKDYRGKYVLLDFWASWCIPCLDEFPHMKKLYNNYNRDEFEILAISIEEDSLRWRQSLKRFQNPWPQLYGGKGFQQPTFARYRGGGIPFYILVDPEGNILRYNDVRPSFNLPAILDSLTTN